MQPARYLSIALVAMAISSPAQPQASAPMAGRPHMAASMPQDCQDMMAQSGRPASGPMGMGASGAMGMGGNRMGMSKDQQPCAAQPAASAAKPAAKKKG
jgi:hypothetical protein